jgi:hypothetical protein
MSPRKAATAADALLGYTDIAKLMAVDVKTVRIYAGSDPDFPARVTPESLRSPGFSRADVDAYLQLRATRNEGRSGRPPRSVDNAERVETTPAIGARIRDLLKAAEPPIPETDLAGQLGLTVAALRFRLRGATRWKRAELEAVAALLETTVDSLIGASRS